MPKWVVLAVSGLVVLALGAGAAVLLARRGEERATSTSVPVSPSVGGTAVTIPPSVSTTPQSSTPTATPPSAPPAPPGARTVTVVTVTSPTAPATTTTAPTTTTTRVAAASGAVTPSTITGPKFAGAPSEVIARSLAEAQRSLGTTDVPSWISQFPFGQFALILSAVPADYDRPNCQVLLVNWSRFASTLTIQQRVGCLGGTDLVGPPPVVLNPNERRVVAFALPLSTVAGVQQFART